MKVTGCSQNNLSRPAFGMMIDFHADNMTTVGDKLPNFELMRRAMLGINLSPEAEYMRPSTVYLRHETERKEPIKIRGVKIWSKVIDVWSAVAGELKSEPFETPRRNADSEIVEKQLSRAVREVCNKFCSDPLGDLVRTLNLKRTVI